MTKMHEHRLEANMVCLAGIIHNLRSLGKDCPEQRGELERAANLLQRGKEVAEEVTCVASR